MTTTVGRIYDIGITVVNPALQLDPMVNLSLDVGLSVKNNGNADDTLTLALTVPDDWVAEYNNTLDILLDEEQDVIIILTCDELVAAGVHTFSLNISSQDAAGVAVTTFTVEILRPDLGFLGNITMTPLEPSISETINLEMTIYNSGTATANMFLVEFWVKGSYYYAEQVFNLTAGNLEVINFSWTPQTTGKYLLEFKIDPQELLIEVDKENNNQSIELDFFADIELSGLTFSNTLPTDGDKITITVTLENKGNVDIITTFTVAFYDGPRADGGALINEVTVFDELPIPVGGELDISTNWVAKGAGEHLIYVEANPHLDFTESDYENNYEQKSLDVIKESAPDNDYSMLIALIFIIAIAIIIFLVLTPSKQGMAKQETKAEKPKKKGGKGEGAAKPVKGKTKKKPKTEVEPAKKEPSEEKEVKFKELSEEVEEEVKEEVETEDAEVEAEVEEVEEVEAADAELEKETLGRKVGKRFGNLITGRWLPTSRAGADITPTEVELAEEEEVIEEEEPELAEVDVAEVEVVGVDEGEVPVDELEPEEVVGLEEEEYEEVTELDDEEGEDSKRKRKKDEGWEYSHLIGIR